MQNRKVEIGGMASPEEEAEKESPVAEETETEVTDTVEDIPDADTNEDKLVEALEEVEKLKDVALRAEAEMQNIRRRAQKDVENAHKFGLERFLGGILPVVDGLEKALEASTAEDDPVIEGVQLTFKLLKDVLAKESIVVIDPVGEPFDPKEHEAMSVVENPDMEPNSVFAVVQKGYKLNERLVRPAMVMVTKSSAESAP